MMGIKGLMEGRWRVREGFGVMASLNSDLEILLLRPTSKETAAMMGGCLGFYIYYSIL